MASSSSSSYDPLSTLASASRRLHDLQTFQLPRLQTCNGSLDLHRELSEEMRGDMERLRRSVGLCRELGEVLYGGEKEEYLNRLDALNADYQRLRGVYRTAMITSKRNITSKARSRRHELLLSRNTTDEELPVESESMRRRGETGDDALQTKTNEVTDALRRTTTLMQTELERSVLSVQMLDESTRTIRLTQSLYDNYTSLLQTSGQLVKALERADWYDRLLIISAFVFFLAVVGWVIKRRVLDKVAGGVGWWIGGSWKLVKYGLGSSPKNITAVGTTAAGIAGKAKVEIRKHGNVVATPQAVDQVVEDSILDTIIPSDTSTQSAVSHLDDDPPTIPDDLLLSPSPQAIPQRVLDEL